VPSAQVGPFIQGSSHDPPPLWGTLSKFQALNIHYIHQAWHIMPSPSPHVLVDLGHGPLGLQPLDYRVTQWHIPEDGIYMVELFGGISSGLITIL
jgi:hypothetical protein